MNLLLAALLLHTASALRFPSLPWRRQQSAAARQEPVLQKPALGGSGDDGTQENFLASSTRAPRTVAAPMTAVERSALLKRRVALVEVEQERLELESRLLRLESELRLLKRGVLPEAPAAAASRNSAASGRPVTSRAAAALIAAAAREPGSVSSGNAVQDAADKLELEESIEVRSDTAIATCLLDGRGSSP